MKNLSILLILVSSLLGCSRSTVNNSYPDDNVGEAKFVGDWKLDNEKTKANSGFIFNNDTKLSISRPGSEYLIFDVNNSTKNKINAACEEAVRKGNNLVCLSNIEFTYDEKSGKLLSSYGSFSKMK